MKEKVENLDNNLKGQKIVSTIEKNIKQSSKVFITGHIRPDYDAIGAAAGVLSMVEQLSKKKKAYIVIGDSIEDIDNDIKKIITDLGRRLNIITLDEYEKLKDDNSILIMVDVNKKNRICFKDKLDDFKEIIIIDHHDEKEGETVETSEKLIYPTASSTSELVTQALLIKECKDSNNKNPKNKFVITREIATLLYSGIELDTDRFKSKTSNITHAVADKLLEDGADKDYINRLFRNDRATYNTIADLIINGTILRQYSKDFKELGISFNLNRTVPGYIYKPEELAKAADVQVGFKDTDAAFSIGYIKNGLVSISARSSSDSINVGRIMEGMYGGGNAQSAGTQIFTDDIEIEETQINTDDYESIEGQKLLVIEDKLMHVVEDFLSLQEAPVVDLEPDLTTDSQSFKKSKKKRRKAN